jgi:hypothetical protein
MPKLIEAVQHLFKPEAAEQHITELLALELGGMGVLQEAIGAGVVLAGIQAMVAMQMLLLAVLAEVDQVVVAGLVERIRVDMMVYPVEVAGA